MSPRLQSELATLFTPSPSRVGHPGDPYSVFITQKTLANFTPLAPIISPLAGQASERKANQASQVELGDAENTVFFKKVKDRDD